MALFQTGSLEEIAEKHGYSLIILRYISTANPEYEIDLSTVHQDLTTLRKKADTATKAHSHFHKELSLPLSPD